MLLLESKKRLSTSVSNPGAGKTHIFQKMQLHCLLEGLRVGVTALMSERARVMGGEHLNWLFSIPVRSNQWATSNRLGLGPSKSEGS